MMKPVIALAGALALSGCGVTGAGESLRQFVVEEAAEANDRDLAEAELFVCQAASVGAIKRRYGQSYNQLRAWDQLCKGAKGETATGQPVIGQPVKE